ncbi:MAG: hypothetical protein EBS42_10660 [Caulobacteraceae bacterium]|nr:hypothetical protein [Caulobacteraceae bacterium]
MLRFYRSWRRRETGLDGQGCGRSEDCHGLAMSAHDSAVEREALAYARGLLKPPLRLDPAWPALAAMAGLAAAAIALAFAMLTAPPPGTHRVPVDKLAGQGASAPSPARELSS